MNKRIRGRRVLFVLASRPSRPRPGAVGLTVAGAAAASSSAPTCYIASVSVREQRTRRRTPFCPGTSSSRIRCGSRRAPSRSTRLSKRSGRGSCRWAFRLTALAGTRRTCSIVSPSESGSGAGKSCGPSFNISNRATVCLTAPTGRSTSRLPKSIAPHALVLHSTRHVIKPIRTIDFSWAFVLRDCEDGKTRLLIRARARYTPGWARPFVELVLGPADFVNVSGMLHGIRARAERRAGARSSGGEVGGSKGGVQAVPE